MPSPAFVNWFTNGKEDVETISEVLAQQLSDNPAELQAQLAVAEGWHGRMTTMLAWANSFLDLAEKAALAARTDEMTDLDRRVEMRAAVADERRARDILQGLCEGIKNRLILGMALMKAQSGERAGGRVMN